MTALDMVGVPGFVHGDQDRMEGHDDVVPRQEVRTSHALPMMLGGSRERLGVRGGGRKGTVWAQLKAVVIAADLARDHVVDRRYRQGRVLRVGGQNHHAAHTINVQAV